MKDEKRTKATMVTSNGGLKITLKPDEVTWFRFLQASRTTNSLAGGWNYNKYWQDALTELAKAPFLGMWTKNSLNSQTPAPRKETFMFDRELSEKRGLLKKDRPLRKGENLDEMSENEINTRLYHDNENGLWGTNIGYEIPLSAESDGQLKVDMLAITESGKMLEIIELKQAGNTGDSPLMALTEAICYGIQVNRCGNELWEAIRAKNTAIAKFNAIRLILAAPKRYWEYWGYWERGAEQVKMMKNIVDLANQTISGDNLALQFDEQSICCLEDRLPACAATR